MLNVTLCLTRYSLIFRRLEVVHEPSDIARNVFVPVMHSTCPSFVLDFAVFVLDILAQTVQESHIQSLLVFAHVVPEGGVGGFARLWSL